MGTSIPVVATERAVEGLWLKHSKDILFARDKEDAFRNCLLIPMLSRPCEPRKFTRDAIVRKFEDGILIAGGPLTSALASDPKSYVKRS